MWALDRLQSSQPSPAPSPPPHRPYSPLQRRSTFGHGPSRTGLGGPSSSQVSLVSNSSNQNTRLANGSGLKNQLNVSPPPDVEDPLRALERILGSGAKKEGDVPAEPEPKVAARPLVLSEDIEFDGLSLQEYADCNDSVLGEDPVASNHSELSVEEYEKERDKFEDLHRSIMECDDILQSVEKYLSSFQNDLGAVSAEIENLQSRSAAINSKVENRKTVEALLAPTVDRVALPPSLVKKISEGPIDEAWVRALEEMQQRARVLEGSEDLGKVQAVRDIKPLMHDLSAKAVERVRDYFAAQIRALRSPNINAQLIQQHGFLRFKPLYSFLLLKQPQLAEELMQAYANTMRWYYHANFTRYNSSLSKLKIFSTDRYDGLGEDPATTARNRTSSSNQTPHADIFNLARRADILRTATTTAMPAHAADDSRTTHHLETPFLAYNLALIDNASFEYTFLVNFLSPQPSPPSSPTNSRPTAPITDHASATRHFRTIFSPILTLGTTFTKSLVAETYDALGILILVRLIQSFAFRLQRRKVPAIESYINGTNMLLWPRFQSIIDVHCNSLRNLTSSLPSTRAAAGSNAASTLNSISGGSGNTLNTAPHPVTQRFANFVHGILSLSSEAGDDEPVSTSLGRLRGDFEAFLLKLAGTFGSGEKSKREKNRFLNNNYSLILTVLGEVGGRLAVEMRERFTALRAEVS